MRTRVRAKAAGLVQGVGFRWFVQERARTMGLAGFVRNLADGTVELEAEGEKEEIDRLLRDVRVGPRSARVTDVSLEWIPPRSDERTFHIR